MAKFIKIKKGNVTKANIGELVFGADQISFVKQGPPTGAADPDNVTLFLNDGSTVKLEDAGNAAAGPALTSGINNALTANPGGVLAFVDLPSTVLIDTMVVTPA